MLSKTFIFALAAIPLAYAHGRIDLVTGDAGGNGTALGIKGAVVPLTGSNSKVGSTPTDSHLFTNTTD